MPTAEANAAQPHEAPPPLDKESAHETLRQACEIYGVSSNGATLLRIGENAIFRLVDPPVVVRISRHRETPHREVAVAQWLADADFPAARLFEDLPQLCTANGRVLTWWEFIDSAGPDPSYPELAQTLRSLHDLEPAGVQRHLPDFTPMPRVAARLTNASTTKLDLHPLWQLFEQLERSYSQLHFALTPGPIHGDAHPGNLMRGSDGIIRLIDFEAFSVGPREWDFASVGAAFAAFGWMNEAEYRECSRIYGWDVLDWPGFDTLRGARELNMTTWLMQLWGHSDPIDDEIQARLVDLIRGQCRREWRRF